MNTLSNIHFSIIRNSRRFHAIEIDPAEMVRFTWILRNKRANVRECVLNISPL